MTNLLKESDESPVISSERLTGLTTPKDQKSKTESLTNSNQNIRIADWTNDSITDGPGLRFVLFVQGCERNRRDCHNPSTHSKYGGRWATIKEILNEIIKRTQFSTALPSPAANRFYELPRLLS